MKRMFVLFILFFTLFSVYADDHRIVIGVHLYISIDEIWKRFSPFRSYLQEKLNMPVELRIAPSFQKHIERIGNNMIDIAVLSPTMYAEVVMEYGEKPIIGVICNDSTYLFKGVIVVRKDSPINRIDHIKNRKVAFVSTYSCMGFYLPVYVMMQNGITLDDIDYEFLGNHDNVVLGVLSGDFDVGCIKEEVYEEYKDKLKIIGETPLIPDHVIVVRSNMDSILKKRIEDVILNMINTEEGREVVRSIKENRTGYRKVSPEEYKFIFEIMKTIKRRQR